MSGRVRIKRDGEWITGYRKTDRRNIRRRAPGPQMFVITFQLPPQLTWSTRAGQVNSFVHVGENGLVTVTSLNESVTRERARKFLDAIVGDLDVKITPGRLHVVPLHQCASG